MNTNSTQETQTAKAKDNPIYIGTAKPGDNAYNLFALPEGHVVYIVSKEEDDNEWSRREEHVAKTEVWIGEGECAMYVYTKENGAQKYLWEERAFMTTYGADAKVIELNDKLGIKLEAKNFMFNIENYLL